MNKIIRRASLEAIQAKLEVTIQQASPRLAPCTEHHSKVTVNEKPETHGKKHFGYHPHLFGRKRAGQSAFARVKLDICLVFRRKDLPIDQMGVFDISPIEVVALCAACEPRRQSLA